MKDVTELVRITDSRATTTSLKVAEIFEKEHSKVLRSIRELECSENFTEANFGLSEYTDSTGRKLPMYNITRDGFTLLAMGFTGEKAMKFKIAYIEAFNAMEKALKEARRGMISEEYALSLREQLIRENERLRIQCNLSRNFLPNGRPGDLNRKGKPKTQFRRGYYTSGNGKSILILFQKHEQPELFDLIRDETDI